MFAGRYELLLPVASGGMGEVWVVLDHTNRQQIAAKILRQSDASSLLRFVREQSMRIDHTHVVTPLSWAGVDERVLFTMPLVRGGSVSNLMADHGPLPVRWVAALTDQTLQALEAVHATRIVHRDIKPGNLLLEPTGDGPPHLRLTDFGIAVPVDEPRMTRASMAIGTPGYMAPEQWHGADPDPRADLYAVGRVAYEMLTGIRPPAENVPIDIDAARTGDPYRDALLDVVALVCVEDVARRPASATALRGELASRGLFTIPVDPSDPRERVVVPDRFGDLPTVADGAPPSSPPPSPPPPSPPSFAPGYSPPPSSMPTRADVPGTAVLTAPTPRSGSRLPALVLVWGGLLGLVVAVWLLLG